MKTYLRRFASGSYWALVSVVIIGIIIYASYVFGGYEFLVQGNWGTDMKSAFAMAQWYDRYFPSIPFWYPVAGGGVSFVNSYPTFSFALVSIVKRVVSIDLVASFAWLGYVSVISFAVGIYIFVALKTKRALMGMLAALFYLISPLAWVWLTDWGFYAEAVSHFFVMPTIIFWDRFFVLGLSTKTSTTRKRYLLLFFLLVFYTLAFITHFGTGYALLGFFVFYVIGYSIRSKGKLSYLTRGSVSWIVVAFLIGLLTLGQTYSFYRYGRETGKASVGSGRNFEQISQSTLNPLHVLGISPSLVSSGGKIFPNATKNIRLAGIVSVLAALGTVFSFRKKYALTFALFSLFAIFVTTYDRFLYLVVNHIPSPLNVFFVWRWSFIALRLTVPFLAAYGLFAVGEVVGNIVFKKKYRVLREVTVVLVAVTLLVGATKLFILLPGSDGRTYPLGARGITPVNIWSKPGKIVLRADTGLVTEIDVVADQCQTWNTCSLLHDQECLDNFVADGNRAWCESYLSDRFYALGVKAWCEHPSSNPTNEVLCNPLAEKAEVESFWKTCLTDSSDDLCSLAYQSFESQVQSTPHPRAVSEIGQIPWFDEAYERIQQSKPDARFDYSPYLSGIGMYGPIAFTDTSMSQLYIYTVSSTSLISKYYSQFSSALFLDDAYYAKSPTYVNNITKWFGVDYLIFDSRTDNRVFEEGQWQLTNINTANDSVTIAQSPEPRTLAEVSNKKRVLIVGDASRGAYDSAYQLAMYGAIPYDQFIFVKGKPRIDDYSKDELSNYDLLILNGYTYNSRSKTDSLLTQYLSEGGSVFIDSGWQYVTPEWEFESGEGLGVIPFSRLSWKSLGVRDDFVIRSVSDPDTIEPLVFNPLDYQGDAWGVSTASRSGLAEWADPLVTLDDNVLMARGEQGAGRVVWSGMNSITHAKGATMSLDEVSYLSDALQWLAGSEESVTQTIQYDRESPDKVVFSLDTPFPSGSTLLWKESYYPDFRAELVRNGQSSKLDIESAGPGWVSIRLPEVSAGDQVIYEYHRSLAVYVAYGIALTTALGVVSGLIYAGFKPQRSFLVVIENTAVIVNRAVRKLAKKPIEWLNSTDTDEDY